jgi:predicted phosphodiesterase
MAAPARDAPPVLLLGIGDTHGDLAPLFEAVRRDAQARALLQVGDLTAGKPGREQGPDDDPAVLASLPVPLVWIHGNHEHWELLGYDVEASISSVSGRPSHAARAGSPAADGSPEPAGRPPPAAAQRFQTGTAERRQSGADGQPPGRDGSAAVGHPPRGAVKVPGIHLWPGDEYIVPGTAIRIVGLPGNYAPTWFDKEKPFPGDRVRHFNAADVAALERFAQPGRRPSVLLMHEAFRGQVRGKIGAMGIPVLARLVQRLRPDVVLTGHHHVFAVAEHGPTLALALPRAQDGYVRLWFSPYGERRAWDFVPFTAPG